MAKDLILHLATGILVPEGDLRRLLEADGTPKNIQDIARDIIENPQSFSLSGLERAVEIINQSANPVGGAMKLEDANVEHEKDGVMIRYRVTVGRSAYAEKHIISANISEVGAVFPDGTEISGNLVEKLKVDDYLKKIGKGNVRSAIIKANFGLIIPDVFHDSYEINAGYFDQGRPHLNPGFLFAKRKDGLYGVHFEGLFVPHWEIEESNGRTKIPHIVSLRNDDVILYDEKTQRYDCSKLKPGDVEPYELPGRRILLKVDEGKLEYALKFRENRVDRTMLMKNEGPGEVYLSMREKTPLAK